MSDIILHSILAELKTLQKENVETIYLSNEALDLLIPKHQPTIPLVITSQTDTHPPTGLPNHTSNPLLEKPILISDSYKQTPPMTAKPIIEKPKKKLTQILTQTPTITLPKGNKEEQWHYLKNIVLNCQECKKHVKPGKQVVFGIGNLDADIFFCGEAPGAEEENIGEPFVGRAGQLLTKIIACMGLERKDVYIGNIMNWRPDTGFEVGNRPPTQEEMEFCLPYLKAQVHIIKPKVIIALGATAVSGLLGHNPKRRMSEVRGKWHAFEHIPLMISFHPSYLLRNNTNATKRQVWEDMLEVMQHLKMPISPKQKSFFLS